MKKDTHPVYYSNAKIVCACGNSMITGSTVQEVHIEICSACHQFYTDKQKLVDTSGTISRYQKRLEKVQPKKAPKLRNKKIKEAVAVKVADQVQADVKEEVKETVEV